MNPARVLAVLVDYAATHPPAPVPWEPEPPMADRHAEERVRDRQWASDWDMDRLAERRAG